MKLGIENFLETYYQEYSNKRIGLVTNMTGVDQQLNSTVDLLFNHQEVQLTALFSPEHGIRGLAAAGEKVTSEIDSITLLPVHSLYGSMRKPSPEMLKDIDVMFIDIQDIGSRYYTYIYTMAYVMDACKEVNIPVVVMDRPNPISGLNPQGNILDTQHKSFVGLYPITNRHSLTIGELATLFNEKFELNCTLTVIPMLGWNRTNFYDQTGLIWIPPSPNVTSIDMALLYVGSCLVEGTNLSEGRGTSYPFEIIGAPFIDGNALSKTFNQLQLAGILARSISFKPTTSKFQDEVCHGVFLHVTDRLLINPLEAIIKLLEIIQSEYPNDFHFIKNEAHERYFFDLLAGGTDLRHAITELNTASFIEKCSDDSKTFKEMIKHYYIY